MQINSRAYYRATQKKEIVSIDKQIEVPSPQRQVRETKGALFILTIEVTLECEALGEGGRL